MRVDFYGLVLETPRISVYLWSPWRAAALEHRLFEVIRTLPRVLLEKGPDEMRLQIDDPKTFRNALQAAERVLKGWQEEADPGSERRSWRWLLEGDTDADGYDHTGEPISLWGFLRLGLERGVPGEGEKNEDIDLEGFGVQVWGDKHT
jgi:hypothetical protein